MLTAPTLTTIKMVARADPAATPEDVSFIERALDVIRGRRQVSAKEAAAMHELSYRQFLRLQNSGKINIRPARATRTRVWYEPNEVLISSQRYLEGRRK
ncbi:MAG: hypothetical protein EOM12_05730 [Verrucomicrobiae bacterium]|nr:hypothetical protein [Verrucomicrobiae bacterium]